MMKKTFLSTLGLLLGLTLFAQIPNGYYDDAEGLSGAQLKTALYGIINGHDVQSYDALWTHFYTTDDKPNGKVWDMYSDIPGGTPPYEYNFGSNQCGNYGEEGDCYNREHSFPKSWFNDASPMVTDIFHIVPTDGYVNGQRSNYPFGEVNNPSWTSLNGSKKGNNSTSGYSGTVFEPRDEYKGDFARIYFYMATRYENVIANWDNNSSEADAALNGTTYPCFETWYLNLLLAWNQADPVSTKEIDRNNAIYNIQDNRNPYVDHPEYVALVWGGNAAPVIANVNYTPNPPNEGVAVNVTATITDDGTVSSAYIYWGYSASNLSNSVAMTHSGSAYSGQIPGQNGGTQVYFKITATDNLGVSTSSSVLNYTVTNSNTSPVITNVQHTPVAPSPDDDVTVSATITDNGTITQAKVLWGYSAGNLANEIVMSHSGSLYSGTIDPEPAGTVVYYKVQATDNEGATSNSSTYSYTVTANNTAPVITSVQHSPSSPSPDDDVTVSATITDNGTITQAKVLWGFSAGNLANEIVMSHTGSLYSGVVDAQTAGTVVYYKVQATDNEGVTSISSTFNYTVVTNNTAPVISNVQHIPVVPSPDDDVTVSATITDNGSIAQAKVLWGYSAGSLANEIVMNHSGNIYSGIINSQNEGTVIYYKVRATDNEGATSNSSTYSYTVTTNNIAPVITNVQHTPVAPSPVDDVTVSATITDNGTITQAKVLWGYSAGNLANEIVMSHSGSLYSGTIDPEPAGTVVYYKVQATDNEGATSNSSTYSYTVTANNTAPVITSVQHSPSSPSPDDDVTVSATITDNGTITQAKVLWGLSAGNLANEIVMSHTGSLYSGIIDAQTAGTVVYYKVQATDNEGVTSNSSTFNYTVVTNNTAPVISNVQHTPTSPDEGEIVTVSATITDDGAISSATIKWGYTSDNLANSVAMTHSGNTYSGQIPGQDADITIYYKVSATDNEGATSNSAINQYNVAGNTNPTPVISNITQYPTSPTNYDYVTISAQITDNGSIEVAEIQYGLAQGQLNQTVDMNSNGNVFSGQIPPHNPDLTIYYRIKAYDDEGAFSYSSVYSYYVDLADGVSQVLTSDLMIVPNPAQQFIQISSENSATENANVELFNVSGQVIQRVSSYQLNEKIDIHGLRSGYYYAKITIGGRISFLPFVVRK